MERINHLISILRCGLEELEGASREGDHTTMLTAMDIIARGYYGLTDEIVNWQEMKIGGTDPD